MSIKFKGSDSILYNGAQGTLLTVGVMEIDTWYKIKARAAAGSALPDIKLTSMFKSPLNVGDQITLVAGDEVWPYTFTELCKVDLDFSGETGIIDATDDCDYPYNSNLPDGFTNLSGSINTMQRFDEETKTLTDVSTEFMGKFLDIIEDDSAGGYTYTPKDDSDLFLQILMNKKSIGVVGEVLNYILTPAVLSSIANNFALKDVQKADFGWSKGQGQASLYKKTNIALVP